MARNDPFGAFRFRVEIDGLSSSGFSQVSGLETSVAVIEYRDGNEPASTRKLPGLRKFGNVTLKRGLTASTELSDWMRAVVQGGLDRRSVAIVLFDEAGQDAARWVLHNAWPTRYAGPTLDAAANEIAIEELTLACEAIERTR